MAGVVFDVVAARLDELPLASGCVGAEKTLLGGGVACAFEDQVLAVASAACSYIEALVGFFVEERVFGVWRPKRVPVEAVMALLDFVFDGVEEGAIVGGPGD